MVSQHREAISLNHASHVSVGLFAFLGPHTVLGDFGGAEKGTGGSCTHRRAPDLPSHLISAQPVEETQIPASMEQKDLEGSISPHLASFSASFQKPISEVQWGPRCWVSREELHSICYNSSCDIPSRLLYTF